MRRARLRFDTPADMQVRASGAGRMTTAGQKAQPGGTDLAYITICTGPCRKTFISCIRDFPVNYMCVPCLKATGEGARRKKAMKKYFAARPYCAYGHPLSETTAYYNVSSNHWQCRECRTRGSAKKNARDSAARAEKSKRHPFQA